MKNELEFEWRSARRWKKLLKPTEDIHLEHVTLDDLHQSTRGFRNAHDDQECGGTTDEALHESFLQIQQICTEL